MFSPLTGRVPRYRQVEYPSGVAADHGKELRPRQVKDQPTLSWDAEDGALYLVAMTGTQGRDVA